MVQKICMTFDVDEYKTYERLVTHPFVTLRCKHHWTQINGEACIGEQVTTIRTHTGNHEVELYESWDGYAFRVIAHQPTIEPQMLTALCSALMECRVEFVTVTWNGHDYRVSNVLRLWDTLSTATFRQIREFLMKEDRLCRVRT